jgi:hypothetical protein
MLKPAGSSFNTKRNNAPIPDKAEAQLAVSPAKSAAGQWLGLYV